MGEVLADVSGGFTSAAAYLLEQRSVLEPC